MLALSGCSTTAVKNDQLTVAVSIIPEATFVEAIAGDLVKVITLIPPGASPTNYQPTPKEMADFSQADVYFTIGVGAEEATILPNVASHNESVKLVELATIVDQVYPARYFVVDDGDHASEGEDNHDHEGRDPHIWMSPKRVVVMANAINQELKTLDPDNAKIYDANTATFIQKLKDLDASLESGYSNLTSKKFIVMHPSIGYLADDYNLEMIAIEEEGKEASVSHLKKVIDYAREYDIHVVFYQQEFDSSQAETIAKEINGKAQAYEPLSADYFGSMKALVEAFTEAE